MDLRTMILVAVLGVGGCNPELYQQTLDDNHEMWCDDYKQTKSSPKWDDPDMKRRVVGC
jgi:hypothetical protein